MTTITEGVDHTTSEPWAEPDPGPNDNSKHLMCHYCGNKGECETWREANRVIDAAKEAKQWGSLGSVEIHVGWAFAQHCLRFRLSERLRRQEGRQQPEPKPEGQSAQCSVVECEWHPNHSLFHDGEPNKHSNPKDLKRQCVDVDCFEPTIPAEQACEWMRNRFEKPCVSKCDHGCAGMQPVEVLCRNAYIPMSY